MVEINQKKSMLAGLLTIGMMLFMMTFLIAALWNWGALVWYEFVWMLMFLMTIIIRMPFSTKNKQNSIQKSKNDLTEIILLFAMFLTSTILPLLFLATKPQIFSFANYQLPFSAPFIGAVLVVLFLWLFWRSHADLGRNWSPGLEVHSEHKLITSGVYSTMRHPMYAAIWLMAIVQPLLLHNWICGFLILPAFLAMYLLRVPKEEQMMSEQFGEDYDAYILQTWRIFPKFY